MSHVLIKCQPQITKRFVVERPTEQLPAGGKAHVLVVAESEVERM
jgi:hypothetical protein